MSPRLHIENYTRKKQIIAKKRTVIHGEKAGDLLLLDECITSLASQRSVLYLRKKKELIVLDTVYSVRTRSRTSRPTRLEFLDAISLFVLAMSSFSFSK